MKLKELLRNITPGKWKLKRDNYFPAGCFRVESDKRFVMRLEGVDTNRAEDKSNAALVCYAANRFPEVVKLLAEADDLLPRINEDDPMGPALAEWLSKIRAILAEEVEGV